MTNSPLLSLSVWHVLISIALFNFYERTFRQFFCKKVGYWIFRAMLFNNSDKFFSVLDRAKVLIGYPDRQVWLIKIIIYSNGSSPKITRNKNPSSQNCQHYENSKCSTPAKSFACRYGTANKNKPCGNGNNHYAKNQTTVHFLESQH